MRIAVVMGAGATLAQALYLQAEGQHGELPPLDTTFFERITKLGLVPKRELQAYAVATLGNNPFGDGAERPGMEAFFKDVFYDFITNRKRGPRKSVVYAELLRLYRLVILDTTDWVCDAADDGPVPALIKAAAIEAEELDVVTFNHDLLIENALADLPNSSERWCLRHGYGPFAENREFSSSPRPSFDDPKTCTHDDPIRVHKLHGSLNWYVDSDTPDPEPEILRGETTSARIRITRRRHVPRNLHHRKALYSSPVVIPPVYAKQPFIRNFIGPVWDETRRAIENAESVVFFGYSMPTLDVEAEMELKRSIRSNKHIRHLNVINPDPMAAGRYAGVFSSRAIRWYPSTDLFLDQPRPFR
jgi:hypothetical protein